MSIPLKVLVVDADQDGRYLLEKTILRKFPAAIIKVAKGADSGLAIAKDEKPAVIISHRTPEMSGVELVREFRALDPTVPIVMVSTVDRREVALSAGADAFLLYDEWLRVGSVIEGLLAERDGLASASA
jgi:DNA-binding NarL/FixJ family response regulator